MNKYFSNRKLNIHSFKLDLQGSPFFKTCIDFFNLLILKKEEGGRERESEREKK